MPVYQITETRGFTRTYKVEADCAETAVEEYDDPDRWIAEPEDDEASIDTEVIAVENEKGEPVGEWCGVDEYGNYSDGHKTRAEAELDRGYPQWVGGED